MSHTLRANDPGEWKSLIHFLRSVSHSRYDFCPRAAELVSQLRNQSRMVCAVTSRLICSASSKVLFLGDLDDATLTGAPRKTLLGSWERLREPDSMVIDNAGYILLFPGEPLELDRELEMNDHKVKIVGISDASAPFLSNPVIHTRYSEAVNFIGRERTQLSYVLVRPQPGLS